MGELNERAMSFEEEMEAVNEMKEGWAPGLDEFPMDYLKKGGVTVLEWLVSLLIACFDMGAVYMDWQSACIVILYKVCVRETSIYFHLLRLT